MGMTWPGIAKPQMTKLLCAIFWTALFIEIAAVIDGIKVVVRDFKARRKINIIVLPAATVRST